VTRHAARLKALKKAVLEVGIRTQLIRLDLAAVDGTKFEAEAGRGSVWSEAKIREELAKLDGQLAAWESEWQANEQRETALFGDRTPWIPPPGAKSEKHRQARAQRARHRLQKALREIEPRFGYLKQVLGVRHFLRRGLPKVTLEFAWLCLATNVGILLRHWKEVSAAL
jgi:hypothetical protein